MIPLELDFVIVLAVHLISASVAVPPTATEAEGEGLDCTEARGSFECGS